VNCADACRYLDSDYPYEPIVSKGNSPLTSNIDINSIKQKKTVKINDASTVSR
jgi:hypothetical protein